MRKACSLLLCCMFVLLCSCQQVSEGVGEILSPAKTFNGVEVNDETTSIEIQPDSDLAELSELAETLTALQTIQYQDREPTQEELEQLHQTFPSAQIDYQMTIGSVTVPCTATELDLSGLKRSEVDEALQDMTLLPNLTSVNLGGVPASETPADPAAETDGTESPDVSSEPADTSAETPDASSASSSGDESSSSPETVVTDPNADYLLLEDAERFMEAFPDLAYQFRFSLFDRVISFDDTELDLNGVEMTDSGAQVRRIMPYLKNLTYLNMENTGVSNEDMAQLRDDFPNVNVVWRIWFGPRYTCRTDTEKILASYNYGRHLVGEDVQVLKYCTKVKYLDLGHNDIDDISFIQYMPDLEVAIVAINKWTDATPLASCKNLEYLEMFNVKCSDLSCLPQLTNLKHLNVCYLKDLTDITPLYQMTWLERLWVGCVNSVPKDQLKQLHEALPDTVVNTTAWDPTSQGWRNNERYTLLRKQFNYAANDYSIY